jgi:CHAT domain-containing protein
MQFRDAILSRAPEDSIKSLSEPIYQQIVAPFQNALSSYENIIIVPDAFLTYLPFEALQSNNNYLVSKFNIKYAPSMTGFSLITKPQQNTPPTLLAVGNSDQYASQMPTLPSVDHEVKSIAGLFEEAATQNIKNVTEGIVKKRIQDNYSFIHVAAHSIIDEENSAQNGIMLGRLKNETTLEDDGFLRSSEIYRLNIPGSVVVLSACESGIGQMINGEGMLGLQRAFFTAGASTVVVSLWDVYDRSTTRFMPLFYKALLENNDSWADSWQNMLRWAGWDESVPFGQNAAALRAAKLTMLDHPKYRHPVYWAPFVVVGR